LKECCGIIPILSVPEVQKVRAVKNHAWVRPAPRGKGRFFSAGNKRAKKKQAGNVKKTGWRGGEGEPRREQTGLKQRERTEA